ncbi:MAG: class I SAM-dependent methyltransferase [Planctomyces sp.]|nr:class I SAM-dependent methyltransferase [Planctomyces sp.]
MTKPKLESSQRAARAAKRRFAGFPAMKQLSSQTYRDRIRSLYDGPAGSVLALASLVSLHMPLVGRMFKARKPDVSQVRSVLDIGSGAGQILGHLVKFVPADAVIVGCDLSHQMLCRARKRLRSPRPLYIAADMTHLPFAEAAFDLVTCGYVLEHLQDPMPGLREFHRVLKPGGKLFLLATEDTVPGLLTSRTWKCRTYSRAELEAACVEAGLPWRTQLWLTPVHRFFKLGGILFEAEKRAAAAVN